MNKKKINLARKKIDVIDNDIFNLIKKRTSVVEHMLVLKKSRKQIVDQKRNRKILKNIKEKSIRDGIDPKITLRIWRAMIGSYIDFQKKNFNKR